MYYFAYGTDLGHETMKKICPDCKPLFPAELPNYKLAFTGWERKWRGGIATIRPFRGGRVMGGVYEISDRDMKLLDRQQGYPTRYDWLNIIVIPKGGDPVEAVTYIRREQSEETEPSKQYLEAMRKGYDDWV